MKDRYCLGLCAALMAGTIGLVSMVDLDFKMPNIKSLTHTLKRAVIPGELPYDIDRDGDLDLITTRSNLITGKVDSKFYENRGGRLVYRRDLDASYNY